MNAYYFTPSPSQHVDESRRMIRLTGQEVHPDRAIILGAGDCSDIPLADLAERFEQVTLNDVDAPRLEAGIAAAGLSDTSRDKLDIRVADLTGITDAVLAKIDAALSGSSEVDTAIAAMTAAVAAAEPAPLPIEGQFDLVVASCVLSQLHFNLVNQSGERFGRRFAGQIERLNADVPWTAALEKIARQMEARFIDGLAALSAQDGLIYLSESPQMCAIRLTADGRWETEGTHRMLRSQDLTDYVDRRFARVAHGRWHWVVHPPQQAGEVGHLFDVQALVLKKWRR